MSLRKTTEQFIKEANIIHNNVYDYSKTNYINNRTKIKIICLSHGIFEQTPSKHLNKQGCAKCIGKNKKTTEQFIKEANIIHNNLYDYSKTNYINNRTKIEIICKTHGIFEQLPYSHLKGKKCMKCYEHEYQIIKNNEDFIEKSKTIHNNIYDYSETNYINSQTKVKIICEKHGIFEQLPYNHYAGKGCGKCNTSKGEQKIKEYLNSINLDFEEQKSFEHCKSKLNRKLKFDFYLSKKNIVIEYDGKQHYEPIKYYGSYEKFKKRIENDKIKNDYCEINNIKLIRIPYFEYKNIEHILKEKIL